MKYRIRLCTVLACLWALGQPPARAATPAPPVSPAHAPVPIADFFRVPALLGPVLSPDGQFLAAAVGNPQGRLQLVVLDLNQLKAFKTVASFTDADVRNYRWVNASRLVYSVADLHSNDRAIAPGLWAVNRDGSDERQLINAGPLEPVSERRLPWQWQLHSVLRDGSADVLVLQPSFNLVGDLDSTKLARLDTTSGRLTHLSEGAPEHTVHWVTDRRGRLAALATAHGGRSAAYLRSAQGWTRFDEADSLSGQGARPVWAGTDGTLLALARRHTDTQALYTLDRSTQQLVEPPIVSAPGYDLSAQMVFDPDTDTLLGVHIETDAVGTVWLDPGMKALQAQVDRLLPGTVNRLNCQRCLGAATLLVTASADRQPPVYYLFEREGGTLKRLASARPWIQPERMGLRDLYRFNARDGLSLPVLVTQPPGPSSGPRPAVLLVHGGPWVRGAHWAWEAQAQFLASRGYVVLEPEFRGSMGYGFKHFQAGWKQWGQAMQDDLADTVQWAVQKGWVDAQRVCIAGASYGGYATLMGLIRHPQVFKCGIDWVGVSDLLLMYDITWSDFSQEAKRFGLPRLLGERVADAAMLQAHSPLAQASRLRRPLLMAHGGADRRVPIEHGIAMRDALRPHNPEVEWVDYPTEGHGWRTLPTKVDFWGRVERFLARHIGTPAALEETKK